MNKIACLRLTTNAGITWLLSNHTMTPTISFGSIRMCCPGNLRELSHSSQPPPAVEIRAPVGYSPVRKWLQSIYRETDAFAVLAMGLICFIPFALFLRGAAWKIR